MFVYYILKGLIYIESFFKEYGNTMIYTVIMASISYVGIYIKKFLDNTYKYFVKKEIVNIVCKTVPHLYGELNNEEKIEKAISIAREMFKDKNISVGDLELRMLIECFFREKGV